MGPGPGHQASPLLHLWAESLPVGPQWLQDPGSQEKTLGRWASVFAPLPLTERADGGASGPREQSWAPLRGSLQPSSEKNVKAGRASSRETGLLKAKRGPVCRRVHEGLSDCPLVEERGSSLGRSETRELQSPRERVADAVFPLSSAGDTSFQPKGENPAVLL